MNFKQVETFLWVSKLLSFSKTAQQQCTTQPAISSRIAALEAELGVTLFDRDRNNKVVLTAKGHELLPYAEKIIYNTLTKRSEAVGEAEIKILNVAK